MAGTRRRIAAALSAGVLASLTPATPALALRALHVDALSMRADRLRVAVGEVFHLAIHIRVREQVSAVDELVVPDVGTMQMLGDERNVTGAPGGTDVVETLTLEPTQLGSFTFKGAYLDAVDARTRKPSRFSANAVTVVVVAAGGAIAAPDFGRDYVWTTLRLMAIVAVGSIVLLIVAVGIAIALSRRRRPPVPVAVAAPPVAAPPRTARDAVIDALRLFRTAPSHDALMRLRAALFAAAAADPGATLNDALRGTADERLRTALAAAERSAFGPAHARDASSADLIDATEGWLR